jgi:hypothetical protein
MAISFHIYDCIYQVCVKTLYHVQVSAVTLPHHSISVFLIEEFEKLIKISILCQSHVNNIIINNVFYF